MILTSIKYIALIIAAVAVCACSSSSGSTSAGTQVSISTAASPSIIPAQNEGAKTFNNDQGYSITLEKAYLVVASATIESNCGPTFSAAAETLLNFIIPAANAHTTSTPTSTGEPHVIDLLSADGSLKNIGTLSPPADQYCGLDLDILAADADASNLPTGADEPNMVGKSLYIEGSYQQAAGGASGFFIISTSVSLSNRELLLSIPMVLSSNNLNGAINIGIHYDTWFDNVDLATLATETTIGTNPLDPQVSRVLQNISTSIHQL